MSDDNVNDDYQQFMEHKRFMAEVEQGIRFANREIIHKHIAHISKEHVLTTAVAVGRLRARYLEAAFKMGAQESGSLPNADDINELRQRREAFDEAKAAFESLREAIEKGYVSLATPTNE